MDQRLNTHSAIWGATLPPRLLAATGDQALANSIFKNPVSWIQANGFDNPVREAVAQAYSDGQRFILIAAVSVASLGAFITSVYWHMLMRRAAVISALFLGNPRRAFRTFSLPLRRGSTIAQSVIRSRYRRWKAATKSSTPQPVIRTATSASSRAASWRGSLASADVTFCDARVTNLQCRCEYKSVRLQCFLALEGESYRLPSATRLERANRAGRQTNSAPLPPPT